MQFLPFELCDFATGAAIPFGKCTVYLTGTATLAALFDSGGTPISNPAIAASNAVVGFAAADGTYDFQFANADGSLNGPKIVKQQMRDLSAIGTGDETIYLKDHGIVADGVTVNSAAAVEALIAALPTGRGAIIKAPMGESIWDRRIIPARSVLFDGYGAGTGQSGSSTASGNTLMVFPAGWHGIELTPSAQGSKVSNMRITQASILTSTVLGSYNTASPTTITLASAWDCINGQVICIEGAGVSITIQDRTVAMPSGSNVVTVTQTGPFAGSLGNPGVYVGQAIVIHGAGAAGADIAGYVGAWTSTTITVITNAGAALNASTTVTTATYVIKEAAYAQIQSGAGTTTLTINLPSSFNTQNATSAPVRHAAPGIYSKTQCKIDNIETPGCIGGLFMHGNTTGNEIADNSSIIRSTFDADMYGVLCEGQDAQVNFFDAIDVAGPRTGFLDLSELGNEIRMHAAFNRGIVVGDIGCRTKMLGGYLESGTSFIAPGSARCFFSGTTSMVPASGWNGFYFNGGTLVTAGLEVSYANFTNGVSLTGTGAGSGLWAGGSISGSPFGSTGAGVLLGTQGAGSGNWIVSYNAPGGAYQRLHVEASDIFFGTTFGASDLFKVDLTTGIQCPNGIVSSSATKGIGYAAGAGGTVTQGTSRATGVTINKVCGQITLFSAAGSATWQTFTVTNSVVAATDLIRVVQTSGADKYMIFVTHVAAGSFDISFATTGGTTTEQPVFNFAVLKAVNA